MLTTKRLRGTGCWLSLVTTILGLIGSAPLTRADLNYSFVETASGVTMSISGETPDWFSASAPINFANQGVLGGNANNQALAIISSSGLYMDSIEFSTIIGDVPWLDGTIASTMTAEGGAIGFIYAPDSDIINLYSSAPTGNSDLGTSVATFEGDVTLSGLGFSEADLLAGAGSFTFLDGSGETLLVVNWTTEAAVPEPSTYAFILGLAACGLGVIKHRKKQR